MTAALLAGPAAAEAAQVLEAEAGRVKGPRAQVVKDRTAHGGRAVALEGRGSLRRVGFTRRAMALRIRARGARCAGAPRLRLVLDGRRRGSPLVRSRRFRAYRIALRASPGRHVVKLHLANPRRSRSCRRRLVIDRLTVVDAPTPPVPTPPVPAPAPATPVPAPAPPPSLLPIGYRNPVAPSTPDPMVLDVGQNHSEYYAFSTGGGFPIRHSRDLVRWEPVGRAMQSRPSWAVQTGDYHPWAPSVIERASPCPGPCFVLFYVSLHADLTPPTNCIGVATSEAPGGPYTDLGPLEDEARSRDSHGRPLGCGDDLGYSNIDPAPYVDSDGKAYLYLSTTNRCDPLSGACTPDREIAVLDLSANLLTAIGPRKPVLLADRGGWEEAPFAPVVENPWMVKRGSTYFLLYSGGNYEGSYGMGYATAGTPTGPFAKAAENPFLRELGPALSVGGGMLVTGPLGGDWLVYHGREASRVDPRTLRIDPVFFPAESALTAAAPTTTDQAAPP